MNAFQSTLSQALPAKRLRIDMKHSNWIKQLQRILENHLFTFRGNIYIPKLILEGPLQRLKAEFKCVQVQLLSKRTRKGGE